MRARSVNDATLFGGQVVRLALMLCLLWGWPLAATAGDAAAIRPGPHDWPWWRGINGNNLSLEPQNPPTKWSATENVLWKTEVPGRGHSSPVIWGERIFLTTADETAKTQSMLCFERGTGRQLWRSQIHQGEFLPLHKKNSQASATAACDGRQVFIPFIIQKSIWLTALDLEGKIAWQKRLGDFHSVHGFAASPVLYGSLVIVVADQDQNSFAVALERQTGAVVWRADRPSYAFGSYASPVVAQVAGREQLLIPGTYKLFSYEPATGKLLWTCDGPANQCVSSAVAGDQLVYACGGYPQRALLCIRADGNGDVTRTHLVWRKDGGCAYVPTPLLVDRLLYMLDDSGKLICFEAKTGQTVWQAKLRGNFSSSPVLAGGNVYAVSEEGVTSVFKPGRKFELVAENELAESGFAMPIICGGRIYLRTLHSLYCIGQR